MSRTRKILASTIAVWLVGCSEADQLNIDIEPAIAVLGGAIMATQDEGRIAQFRPRERAWGSEIGIPEFYLLPKAWAATEACPPVTDFTCDGDKLVVSYPNCSSNDLTNSGYWTSSFTLHFETAGDCTAVETNGFDSTGVSSLIGKTVNRSFGSGGQYADQFNVRLGVLAPASEVVYAYSDFPSGFKQNKEGGVDIKFDSATKRTLVIQGVQVKAGMFTTIPIETSNFDLHSVAAPGSGDGIRDSFDHTINSARSGEEVFVAGPTISLSGSDVTFGGSAQPSKMSFDSDIVVEGNTLQKGAVIRIQHNIAQTQVVAIVTEDLVYSDPNCCYPMSGKIESRYDLAYLSSVQEDMIEFTGKSCGDVTFITSQGISSRTQLIHCF